MISTGSTVTFGTSNWTANLIGISVNGVTRNTVQTSHMGTTNAHTFSPTKLVDWGELVLECLFTPGASASYPPINGAPETITINYGSGTGPSDAFTGFVTGFELGAQLEDQIQATVTIKRSGAPTFGAGS